MVVLECISGGLDDGGRGRERNNIMSCWEEEDRNGNYVRREERQDSEKRVGREGTREKDGKRDDVQYRRLIEGIMFVAQGAYTARYGNHQPHMLLPVLQTLHTSFVWDMGIRRCKTNLPKVN